MLPASSSFHGQFHTPYCMHNQYLKYSLTHHGLSLHHCTTNASDVHSQHGGLLTCIICHFCCHYSYRAPLLQIDFGAQCSSLFKCCYCWRKSQHYSTQLLVYSTVVTTKNHFNLTFHTIYMAKHHDSFPTFCD